MKMLIIAIKLKLILCMLLLGNPLLRSQIPKLEYDYISEISLTPLDVYVALIEIDTICYSSFLRCAGDDPEEQFDLLKIRIEDILYISDTSVYLKENFKSIKYAVVTNKLNIPDSIFFSQQRVIMIASNSTSDRYVKVRRLIIASDIENMVFRYPTIHSIGLAKCRTYRIPFYYRLLAKLGIIDNHKEPKAKWEIEIKDPFDKWIIDN